MSGGEVGGIDVAVEVSNTASPAVMSAGAETVSSAVVEVSIAGGVVAVVEESVTACSSSVGAIVVFVEAAGATGGVGTTGDAVFPPVLFVIPLPLALDKSVSS